MKVNSNIILIGFLILLGLIFLSKQDICIGLFAPCDFKDGVDTLHQ